MSALHGLRLYADSDGLSRVDFDHSIELSLIDFAPPAPPMFAARVGAQALVFIELPVGWQGGWHPSPRRQWVICLSGEMSFQAGDGSAFTLGPGACILTADTHGQGHNSWNAGKAPVRLAVVQCEAIA